MTTTEKDYSFVVSGAFSIEDNLQPIFGARNTIVGFKLPDGREAQLIVALEVLNPKKDSYKYLTSEKQMSDLGFGCLEYDKADFERMDDTN
jgi:hypothetical protein